MDRWLQPQAQHAAQCKMVQFWDINCNKSVLRWYSAASEAQQHHRSAFVLWEINQLAVLGAYEAGARLKAALHIQEPAPGESRPQLYVPWDPPCKRAGDLSEQDCRAAQQHGAAWHHQAGLRLHSGWWA